MPVELSAGEKKLPSSLHSPLTAKIMEIDANFPSVYFGPWLRSFKTDLRAQTEFPTYFFSFPRKRTELWLFRFLPLPLKEMSGEI